MPTQIILPTHVLHADDDEDDRYLFKKVLEQLHAPYTLTSVRNGKELMELLHRENYSLPDVLFLDLNMPMKNGFECLAEIKENKKTDQLPVVVFSTAYPFQVVDKLFAIGAHYYIRKPDGYKEFEDKIRLALSLIKDRTTSQPPFEEFVL